MSTRLLSFKEAIREAQAQCLEDSSVILIGEGVPDPKAIFGTTAGLKDKFPSQVFDMPISENGVTGICIGMSLNGFKPILVHQRMDFSLYSADQIINNAAKWYSMFGGQKSVPMVIRMIVGRGWGQGNQHSQNLTALYAHVPGLKIVMPSNAYDAKGLFISAVKDPNPVLFIEHRWLYETTSLVDEEPYEVPIGIGTCRRDGTDVTVVSAGHATIECRKARTVMEKFGISMDLVDLRSIKPLDAPLIIQSVERTGRLLVVMDEWRSGGIAAEIISTVSEHVRMLYPPQRLTYPNYPSASSSALTKNYYPNMDMICQKITSMMGVHWPPSAEARIDHDVPDQNFRGPF